jgi:serpin B
MRRLLPAILVLVLASGCGATGPAAGAPGDIELAAANAPRLTGSPDDAAKAGAAVNAFGLDLYRRVAAGEPVANLVLSPASIALALSMARAGARGQTAAEMDAVLHGLGADAGAAWVAALDAALTARTGTFPDQAGKPQDVTLRIANAPFAQRGLTLERAYLGALAARFGAGLRLVDYKAAPEAARGLINGWVADETERRIPELIGQGAVTDQTRLVLVNAIYLKAAWQLAFFEGATAPAPFTRPDGSSEDVPMMHVQGQLGYAAGDGWRAVELPYVGGKLAMVVIVPDDLAAFEATFDGPALSSITGAIEPREVMLGLPKFGAESRLELARLLGALGMPTAFGDTADFSGITAEEQLVIDAVIHQANIDVDERGTEAAAATAVMMRATAMPAEPVELTVDRPFLFALRDTDTGAVVFLGRIADPTASAGS